MTRAHPAIPSRRSVPADYGHLHPLFLELVETPTGSPRHSEIREQLVNGYMPVARHIAQRFRHRGEPYEDLLQVATVGLILAVDRFDPTRGTEFLSFAVPTIMGEVRRHFRDTGWAIRVPRQLQDRSRAVLTAGDELAQAWGRTPTPREVGTYLDLPVEQVYEALAASRVYRSRSLDQLLAPGEDGGPLTDHLRVEDEPLVAVEDSQTLLPLLRELPLRERRILMLRFYGNMTQTEIADRLGISQMHVSRLLSRTLDELRRDISRPRSGTP